MAIPKVIIQTFKTGKLPWLTRYHIWKFRKRNPAYHYEFYDDERILNFFKSNFDDSVTDAYLKLGIGAAKADMFRYAVLFKRGGVYLDIDGTISGSLDELIKPDDFAVISKERNPGMFVQWALIFAPEHPILKRVLELVIDNINSNPYPYDVHRMTGPSVYSQAVSEYIQGTGNNAFRMIGIDFEGRLKPKYLFNKLLLYGKRSGHWKKEQHIKGVLNAQK